jgi:lysophospholipase L1-like esterase
VQNGSAIASSAAALRRRALLRGLAVSGIATVVALVLAEIAFRWFGPRVHEPPMIQTIDGREIPLGEIAHFLRTSGGERADSGTHTDMPAHMHARVRYDAPRWDYFDAQGCISVRTNRLGFRDAEFDERPREDELRVLAIGDSFTFGSGVQGEDTWPQQLERMLQLGELAPVQIINGGFAAGHAPSTYAQWVATKGLSLGPRLVIVGFCLNDMGGRVPMLAYPVERAGRPLLGVSKLGEFMHRQWRLRAAIDATNADYEVVLSAFPGPWQDTQRGLVVIQRACEQQGVHLVVAVFPMLSLLGPKYPYKGLHARANEFLEAQGIAHVDLYANFAGRDEHDLWADVTDQHPNDVGQHIIAQGIRDWLARNPSFLAPREARVADDER